MSERAVDIAGNRRRGFASPVWWRDFSADFARYRDHRAETSALVLLATEQGLWALLMYRVAHAVRTTRLPPGIAGLLRTLVSLVEKLVEIVTGITLPSRARIGPGLYIGHHGNIIVHEDAVIGHTCNISQGVTIGTSGRGTRRGAPRIGNRVYVAANAVVVGRITVGDEALIAANSLVTRDVEPGTTVMGVPASLVKRRGSTGYIGCEADPFDVEAEDVIDNI